MDETTEHNTKINEMKFLLRDLAYVKEEEKVETLECLERALRNKSYLPEAFYDAKGLTCVIASLKNEDNKIRYQGLLVLRVACKHGQNKEELATDAFFEIMNEIVNEMEPGSSEIQNLAFTLVSYAMEGKDWLLVPSASECVLKIMKRFGNILTELVDNDNVDGDFRSALVPLSKVVKKCCSAPEEEFKEQLDPLIEKIVQLVNSWMDQNHVKLMQSVMNILGSVLFSLVMRSPESKEQFERCNGIQTVVKSLQTLKAEDDCRDAVVELICVLNAAIEGNEQACSLAGAMGIMPLLTKSFEVLDFKGRETVAHCLVNIVKVPDNARALYRGDLDTWLSYLKEVENAPLYPVLEKIVAYTVKYGRSKCLWQSHPSVVQEQSPGRTEQRISSESELESSSINYARRERDQDIRSRYMPETPYSKRKNDARDLDTDDVASRRLLLRSKSLDRRLLSSRIPVSSVKNYKGTDVEDNCPRRSAQVFRSDSSDSMSEDFKGSYKKRYDGYDSESSVEEHRRGRNEYREGRSRLSRRSADSNRAFTRSVSRARHSEPPSYENMQRSRRSRRDFDDYLSAPAHMHQRSRTVERGRYQEDMDFERVDRRARPNNAIYARSRSLARDGMLNSRSFQNEEYDRWDGKSNFSRPSASLSSDTEEDTNAETEQSEPRSLLEAYGHRKLPARSSYPWPAARDDFPDRSRRNRSVTRRGFSDFERSSRGGRGGLGGPRGPGNPAGTRNRGRGRAPERGRGRGRGPPNTYPPPSSGGWAGESEFVERATSDSESEGSSHRLERKRLEVEGELMQESEEKVPFTAEEDENIRKGIEKYGVNFQIIQRKFKFAAKRSTAELFQRWKALSF